MPAVAAATHAAHTAAAAVERALLDLVQVGAGVLGVLAGRAELVLEPHPLGFLRGALEFVLALLEDCDALVGARDALFGVTHPGRVGRREVTAATGASATAETTTTGATAETPAAAACTGS